jgi:hypothetical protein
MKAEIESVRRKKLVGETHAHASHEHQQGHKEVNSLYLFQMMSKPYLAKHTKDSDS